MKKVCVIGAGPAGIIAAGYASKNGHDVTLYDKNKMIGKKLLITGKGRCNITNYSDITSFFDQIVTNEKFLYSALYSFDNFAILRLLEEYGLKYKVERGDRVFPESDRSLSVQKAFLSFLKDNNVNIKLNKKVDKIIKEKNKFKLIIADEQVEYDSVVIATGGLSYQATGSTGDGYRFAESFGHNIISPKPGLVPLKLKNFDKELQGLSLKNVNLKLYNKKKLVDEFFGEMLFTHFGISGPIVLTMSSIINKFKDQKDLKLYIDLKPALSYEKLDNRILRDFSENPNRILGNSLGALLPKKLIEPVIAVSKIDYNKVINQLTLEERMRLIESIKAFPLKYDGMRDINEAIITSGGVKVDEINPSTMESKLVDGLYFVGEIIDTDALTGGYNLQIAYSTGYLAGSNI